jgi:hypothetical protein
MVEMQAMVEMEWTAGLAATEESPAAEVFIWRAFRST